MATPRNFTNNASGASVNGSLSAGATTALLNNYSNFPAAPFTATIGRNQPDEEIVLVTAVAGSTVTITRGYDGSAGQAHSAGTSFEHTAVAKDFRDASAHVEATGAVHGLLSALVGVDDVQTLTNKTAKLFKALADNTGAAFEADNSGGGSGKLFRGLQAGVEKFFVDFAGNLSAQGVTGTTGSFSGALTAAASTLASLSVTGGTTLTGLLSANGGVTVPTGKKITLTDAPVTGTDAANKTYTDNGDTAAKAYADGLFTTPPASRTVPNHRGSGTVFPTTTLVAGDTFNRTDWFCTFRYDGANWQQIDDAKMTLAQRTALTTAGLPADFQVYETDTGDRPVWNASSSTWDNVWITYTPTWACIGAGATQPSLGNGTLLGRYRKQGRRVDLRISLLFGATTNGGAGAYTWTLPFASVAGQVQFVGTAKCFTTAGTPYSGHSYQAAGANYLQALFPASNTNTGNASSQNAAAGNNTQGTGIPLVAGNWTFGGTGDIQISLTYETAA